MLTQFALASAESAINAVLQLDSTAQQRLAPLAGKVIAIACSQPNFTLYLIPLEDSLQLAKEWHAPVDCTLTAPAHLLLSWPALQIKPQCYIVPKWIWMAIAVC